MLLLRFLLFAWGWEALQMVNRNDHPYRGVLYFTMAVLLWFWRPILEWFLDQRWREDFRDW
jgi:hypothetical protein